MSKLIVTSDKHNLGELYSFLILDLETNKVVGKAPYTELLNADIPINAGRKSFRPFGIAQSDDHIFISSNSNIVRFDNKTFEPIDLVCDTGVINTHQIAYYEGYLYRTNTCNDTISRIDLNTLEEIHFDFKTMSMTDSILRPDHYSKYDTSHLNSFLVYEDHIYVMAHNNNVRDSEVFKLSLDFKTVHHVANLDRSHHEIIIHDGFLYSLGTGAGNLIKLDLDSFSQEEHSLVPRLFPPGTPGRRPERVFSPGALFLRGMEIIDNKLEIFASPAFQNRPIEEDDYATRMSFDIKDYSVTKRLIDDLEIVACVQQYKE